MAISIVPESPSCDTSGPPSSLLRHLDDQIISDDSFLALLCFCCLTPGPPQMLRGPCGAWTVWWSMQKRHLSLLVGILLKEHQLCHLHGNSASGVTIISCFTYSFHPCPWLSQGLEMQLRDSFCSAPLWCLRLCFWVKLVTTPISLQGKISPSSLLSPSCKKTSDRLSC